MDQDLSDKIKEIGGMLGISEMPENIGDIVSSFLSSNASEEAKPAEEKKEIECCNIGNTNSANSSDLFSDLDMTKVLKLMSKYKEAKNKKTQDKKVRLLYAVEPFLNEKRKDKVGNCVKFLTFAEIAKNLKDL